MCCHSSISSVTPFTFLFSLFETFPSLYTLASGSLSSQSKPHHHCHPSLSDMSVSPLSKFSVHWPPDSHPSTWVQFKKPFNSCHSTELAISPAAKAQTGTLPQQATLNVRLVPNGLKVKDSISQRLVLLETGSLRWRQHLPSCFLTHYCQHLHERLK